MYTGVKESGIERAVESFFRGEGLIRALFGYIGEGITGGRGKMYRNVCLVGI